MATPQHRYQACRDRDCERIACAAWREGREEGYTDGHAEGFAEGYAAGAAAAGGE
jgi:flagellar biosynthesis/type III secretory pathway protein FliH